MDTDSAYMALSGPLESIIKPHLRRAFYHDYGLWFPKPFCAKHKPDFMSAKLSGREWVLEGCCSDQLKYDKRTPGLFKNEFVGDGVIALNSKTYFCWNEEAQKVSSKGLSKTLNTLTRSKFMSVLNRQNKVSGVNRGFLFKKGNMYSYEQVRTGLTYFYGKRMVCEDGVSTLPLDL